MAGLFFFEVSHISLIYHIWDLLSPGQQDAGEDLPAGMTVYTFKSRGSQTKPTNFIFICHWNPWWGVDPSHIVYPSHIVVIEPKKRSLTSPTAILRGG